MTKNKIYADFLHLFFSLFTSLNPSLAHLRILPSTRLHCFRLVPQALEQRSTEISLPERWYNNNNILASIFCSLCNGDCGVDGSPGRNTAKDSFLDGEVPGPRELN